MSKRRDGTGRKLPLKPKHYVGEDHQQGKYHCQPALLRKLVTNLGTNEFDSPQIDIGIVRGKYFAQGFPDRVRFDANLWRQANLHIGLRPEPCYSIIVVSGFAQATADAFQVGGLGIANLEQYAARKIDSEIETTSRERANGDDKQHSGDGKRNAASRLAQEVNAGFVLDQSHRCSLRSAGTRADARRISC
jgi:hypothetical protein